MMKFAVILIFLFTSAFLAAQSDLDLPKTREVIITEGDSMIKANILYAEQKDVNPKRKSEYHWYHSNSIKKNKGAYYGKLLYGEYIVFDEANNMVKRGKMNRGRKDGTWVEWYSDGELKAELNWRKGICHGSYFLYDKEGKIKEKGRYKRGVKQDKKVQYFGQEEASKIKYVNLKRNKRKEKSKRPKESTEKKSLKLFNRKTEKEARKSEKDEEKENKTSWWKFWKKSDSDNEE